MRRPAPQALGHLAMLAFSALVAGSFSLGAQIANELPPTALMAARFTFAAVLLGAMVVLTGQATRHAAKAPWRYLLLGGTFAFYFVLMFEGLKTASAVSTAAVFTLTPVLAAIAGYVLLRQITTGRMAFALAVGALGALWVIFRADLGAFLSFEVGRGEIVYFIGCIAHGIYTPLVAKLNRGENALVFTFGTMLAGAILLILWSWSDIRATDWPNLPALVWITLGYLAVFSGAITIMLLQIATLRLPSAKVMAYTYLTPSWVILWELALGQTPPPPLILAGVGLTVVALILLLRDETAQVDPAQGQVARPD